MRLFLLRRFFLLLPLGRGDVQIEVDCTYIHTYRSEI